MEKKSNKFIAGLHPEDRKFIIIVLLVAVVLRFIVMTAYFQFWLMSGKQDVIGPDGETFSQIGWYINTVLSGNPNAPHPTGEFIFQNISKVIIANKGQLPPIDPTTHAPFTYFIGFVYFLFGYVPLVIKSFNIIISAFSSILVYLIALEISTRRIGRISFLMFTFFPSIFIFSITILREPFIILCILFIIYLLIRLKKEINFKNLLFLMGTMVLILFLRKEMFIIMSIVTFISLIDKITKRKILLLIAVFILVILSASTLRIFPKINFKPSAAKNLAATLFLKHVSQYCEGGRLVYRIFPERFYENYNKRSSDEEYLASATKITTVEFLKYLPKGIFFYIARPFPFVRHDFIYRLMSFQMLYWYVIVALSLPGLLKTRFSSARPIFAYLLLMLLATSMAEGNEGILFRHRDSITPFFILFAATGIDRIAVYWQAKIKNNARTFPKLSP